MYNNVGLAVNPEPKERKHYSDATYITCDECGREIWNDTEEWWLEGIFGALCSDCVDNLKHFG